MIAPSVLSNSYSIRLPFLNPFLTTITLALDVVLHVGRTSQYFTQDCTTMYIIIGVSSIMYTTCVTYCFYKYSAK
jgi:hypothetical protein